MKKYCVLDLKEKAFNLQCKFITKYKQQWGLRESVEELNIQIGHLCQSLINNMLIKQDVNAFNQPNRILQNISDELCDCFLSICSIYKFYGIKNEQLTSYNVSNKNFNALVMELFILSSQLLDSCLIIYKIKPALNRNEHLIFMDRYSAILNILEFIPKKYHLDINAEFDKMIKRTLDYLQGDENVKGV